MAGCVCLTFMNVRFSSLKRKQPGSVSSTSTALKSVSRLCVPLKTRFESSSSETSDCNEFSMRKRSSSSSSSGDRWLKATIASDGSGFSRSGMRSCGERSLASSCNLRRLKHKIAMRLTGRLTSRRTRTRAQSAHQPSHVRAITRLDNASSVSMPPAAPTRSISSTPSAQRPSSSQP